MTDPDMAGSGTDWPRESPPRPPGRLVGRHAVLARLREHLQQISVAVIYGLPGIGKTALVTTYTTDWSGPVIYCRGSSAPLSELLDDARRQLCGENVREAESDAARVSEVLHQLEAIGGLWFFDDLHQVDQQGQLLVVERSSLMLRRARFIATSRHRLTVSPQAPDRCELTLPPLDTKASLELWSVLDELYGPVASAPRAVSQAKGSPFLLRRAHAGGAEITEADDPVMDTLAQLCPDDRRLAEALSVSRIHLPERVLAGLLPAPQASAALRQLFRLAIIERDGGELCSIHDLFRVQIQNQVQQDGAAEEIKSLHASLAASIADSSLPEVQRCREVTHHYHLAGEPQAAGAYLLSMARVLVRQGAAAELLKGLDRLGPNQRTPAIELVRARCLVRLNEAELGYQLLSELLKSQQPPPARLSLAYVEAALSTGRLRHAEEVLLAVVEQPGHSKDTVLRGMILLANLRAIQGRQKRARQIAQEARQFASQPLDLVKLCLVRTFSYWIAARYKDAAESIREALRLLFPEPLPRSSWRMYITFSAIYSNLGRLQEAEELLQSAGGGLDEDDELVPVSLNIERAILLSAKGQFSNAIAVGRRAQRSYSATGMKLGAWWSGVVVGRNLLLAGQVNKGTSVLEATARVAKSAGAISIQQAAQAEEEMEPLRFMDQAERWTTSPIPSLRRRARLVLSLRQIAAGEETSCQSASTSDSTAGFPESDCGFDQCLSHLREAIRARVLGDGEQYRMQVGQARQVAAACNVDEDLVDRILDRLGRACVVTGEGHVLLVDAEEYLASHKLVLDGQAHELRMEGALLRFRSRPVLRAILYALARQANQRVPNDALVRAAWDDDYNPLKHDTSIRVNITRLRALLKDTPLNILREETGYSLSVCSEFSFIESIL